MQSAHEEQDLQSNIPKYYALHFFFNLQLWFPIWVIYLTEKRGLSLAEVTLIDVPFWGSIILLQIPGAALADRWGRRPTLVAAGCAFATAITFFGLANSFWLILGSYLVWGIGFALFNGTESAFIYDSLKAMGRENEYPRIYGRAWGIATAATLAGTLLGAPLASATDLSFPIVLSGGIALGGAVAALTFREPPVVDRTHHMTYGRIIREAAGVVRRQPAVRYSILFYGLITVGNIAPIFFFQIFLVHHHVDLGQVGFWQTPMRIAAIVAALGAHSIISRLGERRTFYLMPAILIGSYAVLASWDSVYAQVAFPAMNFVVVLSQPTLTDYLNRRVPSEQRATIVSLTNLVRSMVLIPSAPLLGLLADEASTAAAYWAGAVVIATLSVPLLLLWLPSFSRGQTVEPGAEAATAGD